MIRALRSILGNAGLRRLAGSYAVSLVALWAYSVAASVYAFDVGGAALVGVVGALKIAPAAIGAPFTAVLVDRYPRRLVLIATAAIGALMTGLAAVAVLTDMPPAIVFAIGALLVLAMTAFEPAKSAALPSLADDPEQLAAANALINSIESSSIFLGPALGGLILAAAGIGEVLVVASVLLLLAGLLVARIPPEAEKARASEDEEPPEEGSEVLAGFAAIRRDGALLTLIGLYVTQTFVDGVLGVLIIAVAFDLLDLGASAVGWLSAVVGIGGLIGGALLIARASQRTLGRRLAIGLVLWGTPIALVGVFAEPTAAFVLLAILGIGNSLIDVSAITLIQRVAPERVLGRVLGAMESLIWGSIALGSLAAPLLIDLLGVEGALIATGCLLPALAVATLGRLRAIDASAIPSRGYELMEKLPLFAPLGSGTLEALAGELRPVRISAGADVIRQGDEGDDFYLIESGTVEVFEDSVRVREQGPGEHFGEIALVRSTPRTATVRAIDDVELLALDGERFVAAVTGHPRSAEEAEAVIGARLGSARRRLASL
jgi:MFS family permease